MAVGGDVVIEVGGDASGFQAGAVGGFQEGMAQMVAAAQEYAARLNAIMQEMAVSPTGAGAAMASMQQKSAGFFGELGTGMASFGEKMGGFGEKLLGIINPLNLLNNGMVKLMEVMAGWRLMEGGFQAVSNFAKGIFDLPIAMEKAQGAWSYMFNEQRMPGQSMAAWRQQGITTAQDLADWTMKASISLPYTRQDLIQGITSLGPAKFSAAGIENYMPVIADVAGAQNPNLSLQQASYSIMGAMMGYTRMLRYDLHIAPEELAQFGYDQGNPSTLMPAMVRWSQFQGTTNWVKDVQPGGPKDLSKLTYDQITAMVKAGQLQSVDVSNMDAKTLAGMQKSGQMIDIGAAYQFSHGTFWGELSSFWDRIQNSQLAVGDYGPFKSLKQGLEWVNSFMDMHADQIGKLAKLVGTDLSDAMQAGAHAFMAFAQGLGGTGLGTNIDTFMQNLGKWLSNPQTIKGIEDFARTMGTDVGTVLDAVGPKFKAFGDALETAKKGWDDFFSSITPGDKSTLGGLAGSIGTGLDTLIKDLGLSVKDKLHTLAAFVRLFNDMKHGNWDAALQDLKVIGADYGQDIWNVGSAVDQAQAPGVSGPAQGLAQIGLNALGGDYGPGNLGGLFMSVDTVIIQGLAQATRSMLPQFRTVGIQLMQEIVTGINAQKAQVELAMLGVTTTVVQGIIGIINGFFSGGGKSYSQALRQGGSFAVAGATGFRF